MHTGDGDRYEGRWEADRPAGEGTLWQAGTAVEVEWRGGRPHPKTPYVERPPWAKLLSS